MDFQFRTLEDAQERVANYVMVDQTDFIIEEIPRYKGSTHPPDTDFSRWANYVLSTTAYGSALVCHYKADEVAILKDLQETWDEALEEDQLETGDEDGSPL